MDRQPPAAGLATGHGNPIGAGPPPTSHARLDAAVARLGDYARRYAALSIKERIELAQGMLTGYLRIASHSVELGCKAKGLAFDSPAAGEEWATGPWPVVRQLRLIIESLRALAARGNTPIGAVARGLDGHLKVDVFPNHAIDKLLFSGLSAEVRLRAGVDKMAMARERARFYKSPGHDGRVVLILGAGNIASIPPMDVITKMFNEGKTCLLKMNPVNAYLGPLLEDAFGEAIHRGFLGIVYGGAEAGAYLARHRGVDEIHITGSSATHDTIVWGAAGSIQTENKRTHARVCKKEVTSELGNISPVLIVPGPYTGAEIAYQATDIAGYVAGNASFWCNAAKMLVTPRGWPGREGFLDAIAEVLRRTPARKAYYPGALARWQHLTANRERVQRLGQPRDGDLPWTLITDLDPTAGIEPLFVTEPFCSILSETAVGSSDPLEYLDAAVDFVNGRLWGTLSATLIVHPKLLRDTRIALAVEQAIIRLRYGTVAVNIFPGLGFGLGVTPWGAYPGASLEDVRSGIGFVHNTSMLEHIEKTIIRAPLRMFPKPIYHPNHRSAQHVMRRLLALEQQYHWSRVPPVVVNALRG